MIRLSGRCSLARPKCREKSRLFYTNEYRLGEFQLSQDCASQFPSKLLIFLPLTLQLLRAAILSRSSRRILPVACQVIMFLAFRRAEIAMLTEASSRLSSDVCTLPAITAATRHGRSRFHLSLFFRGTVPTNRPNDHVRIVSTNTLSRCADNRHCRVLNRHCQ